MVSVLPFPSQHPCFCFLQALWFLCLWEALGAQGSGDVIIARRADSSPVGGGTALRPRAAQGSGDVIITRRADSRRWVGERLCGPARHLLSCCSSGIMAPSLWKALVFIGLFALAHAAFSAAQHRCYMRLTEREDESLPVDTVLQTLLAFAVTCYGIVHIAGELKDVDATSELKNKTSDTLRNHPSFYVFNHRGGVLFRRSDATDSSNQDVLSSNPSWKLRKLEAPRRQDFYKS